MESVHTKMWEEAWPWPALGSRLDPVNVALLMVDFQNQSINTEDGYLAAQIRISAGSTDYRTDRVRKYVLPNSHRLLDYFRGRGMQIIFLTVGPEMADRRDEPQIVRIRNVQRAALVERPVLYHKGTRPHSIIEELAPRPGELVVNKRSAGAFNSSNLDNILRHLGVRSLVIGGVATNACVESTTRGASDSGYQCVLVEDVTSCEDPFLQRQSLRSCETILGRVQTTTGVLAELEGDHDTARTEGEAISSALLTPRHVPLEHYQNALPFPPIRYELDTDSAALIVVDMQYRHHPDHGVPIAMQKVKPGCVEYYRHQFTDVALPNCKRLVDAFRTKGREVIFVTTGPEGRHSGTTPGPKLARDLERERLSGLPMIFPMGTFENRILNDLEPQADELVVNKLGSSAMVTGALEQTLRNMGITSVVICGALANDGVESTARDAAERGFRTLLVSDACVAYDPAAEEATMRSVRNNCGRVAATEAALEELFGS